jgi:hypothetical protein
MSRPFAFFFTYRRTERGILRAGASGLHPERTESETERRMVESPC